MSNLLLTREEKQRFIDWLRFQADSNKGMIVQMEKMKLPAAVITKLKTEMAAYLIVLKTLESTEEMTLK